MFNFGLIFQNNKTDRERLIGLEAVRALAIVAVLFYHLNMTGFFNAGFLGVDVFFNLSGFLITCLLLREFQQKGDIAIGAFYLKRFRRLFPATAALIVGWLILAPIYSPDSYERLCKDVMAALFYYSNWWQIYSSQSYFETFGNPPLLLHLWSLAVEEQFYIVWPLALLLLLKHMPVQTVGRVCMGLAVLSTVWMAYVYDVTVDGGDPSRAYLGADTHAMGLFLGAALACYWSPWQVRDNAKLAWVQHWRGVLLGVALSALTIMLLTWNEGLPVLFKGGFFLAGICTLLLIVALTDVAPEQFGTNQVSRVAVVLVRWVGTRSYSIYLWHWPIFIACQVGPDQSWRTVFTCFVLTVIAAEISYRCVERPFQTLEFKNLAIAYPFTLAGLTLVCVAGVGALLVEPVQVTRKMFWPDPVVTAETVYEIKAASPENSPVEAIANNLARSSGAKPKIHTKPKGEATKPKQKPAQDLALLSPENKKIVAVGDSVLLGASDFLIRNIPDVTVDAMTGRQAHQGLQVVKRLRQTNEDVDYAVIHLGTNGYIVESQFTQMLKELSDLKLVTVFNVYANRRWMEPNNEIIERVTKKFPNVRVVNWYEMGKENPQFFVKDGVHLSSEGIVAMVKEISKETGVSMRRLPPNLYGKKVNSTLVVRPVSSESKPASTAIDEESVANAKSLAAEDLLARKPPPLEKQEDK